MAIQSTIQDYAKAINSSWHKTTDSVLETARLCAEAEKKLRPEEKNKLFKDLDFNKATFSKLAKIGSQPRLQTDAVKVIAAAELHHRLRSCEAAGVGPSGGDQGRRYHSEDVAWRSGRLA